MRICADRFVAVNLKNPVQTRSERAAYYRRLVERHDSEVEVAPEDPLEVDLGGECRALCRLGIVDIDQT